jgi:hypothetical protein
VGPVPPAIAAAAPVQPPPIPVAARADTMREIQAKAGVVLNYGREVSLNWLDHAKKAFAKHVRDIPLSTADEDRLTARGIRDPAVQRHLSWRRSLLNFIVVPTAFTALMGTINTFGGDLEGLAPFGMLVMLLYAGSLWAIPACSFLAARAWDRPRASRKILLIAFLASFLLVVLLGMFPFKWWIKIEDTGDPATQQMMNQMVALIGGLVLMMAMLPAVLSLLPGAIRACVRIKVLFPESIVSGWLLITIAPLYALFLLTLFILINQAAGSLMLIVGVAALVAAPVTYLMRTPLFIRPLWTDGDREQVARAQWVYIATLAVAGALLVLYALTAKFMERPLVGLAKNQAFLGFGGFTWHTLKFVVDYIGRSLFITSIAMDYFLLVNVSAWQNTRAFEQTDHAAEYERTIGELGAALTKD